jgi:hypothetical protein
MEREVAKDIKQAPAAATATKFEYGLDERIALASFCAHADIVEHAFGPGHAGSGGNSP